MTTAGNGPGPSGFMTEIGIGSDVPLAVAVGIDVVAAQPASARARTTTAGTRRQASIAPQASTGL
jgi:hypothetical protein